MNDQGETTEAQDTADAQDTQKKGLGPTALRFATALPLIPILLYTMFWAPWWAFPAVVLVGTGIASAELMAMTQGDSRALRTFGVLGSLGLAAVALFVSTPSAVLASVLGLVVLALLGGLVRPDPVETSAMRVAWLVAGPLYVGGTLATMGLLHQRDHGGAWVLFTMVLAWMSDTGAYFAGRALGKTKLYPKLSPKKTVEGSLGGLVSASAAAVAVAVLWIPEVPVVDAAILAVIAAALGQAGDLFESLIKRSTGVKDSGTIMPGHGGILDRVDALMFTGTTAWLYATFVLPLR